MASPLRFEFSTSPGPPNPPDRAHAERFRVCLNWLQRLRSDGTSVAARPPATLDAPPWNDMSFAKPPVEKPPCMCSRSSAPLDQGGGRLPEGPDAVLELLPPTCWVPAPLCIVRFKKSCSSHSTTPSLTTGRSSNHLLRTCRTRLTLSAFSPNGSNREPFRPPADIMLSRSRDASFQRFLLSKSPFRSTFPSLPLTNSGPPMASRDWKRRDDGAPAPWPWLALREPRRMSCQDAKSILFLLVI